MGARCVPKAEDSPGEDAYFASHPLAAFGLADGVGGWAREGVDSGVFSRALLGGAHGELKRRAAGMSSLPNLPETAHVAFEAVREEQIRGSSTLMLAQLHMNTLSILNLGDCGVLAFRPTTLQSRFVGGTPTATLRLLYRSSAMMHRPNLPFQLSSMDKDGTSSLESLDLVALRLRRGDVVVAGTDGLFDNVGEMELKNMVLQHQKDPALQRDPAGFAAGLADAITARAAEVARVPHEFGGGGKLDDIAVVVARAEDWTNAVSGSLLHNLEDSGAVLPQ